MQDLFSQDNLLPDLLDGAFEDSFKDSFKDSFEDSFKDSFETIPENLIDADNADNTDNITARIVLMTPEMAKEILCRNDKNKRKLSWQRKKLYTDEMKENKWKFNGIPIVIDNDGNLLDGQHRLSAIVSSEKPQKCLIVEGINSDVYCTIDVGMNRTKSQLTYISGIETNSALISSAAEQIIRFKKNKTTSFLAANILIVSPEEIIKFIKENPKLAELSSKVTPAKRYMSDRVATALYFLFDKSSPIGAQFFMNKLMDKEATLSTEPIAILQKKLLEYKRERNFSRYTRVKIWGMTIKAWNLYQKGKTQIASRLIAFDPDTDDMPEIM